MIIEAYTATLLQSAPTEPPLHTSGPHPDCSWLHLYGLLIRGSQVRILPGALQELANSH